MKKPEASKEALQSKASQPPPSRKKNDHLPMINTMNELCIYQYQSAFVDAHIKRKVNYRAKSIKITQSDTFISTFPPGNCSGTPAKPTVAITFAPDSYSISLAFLTVCSALSISLASLSAFRTYAPQNYPCSTCSHWPESFLNIDGCPLISLCCPPISSPSCCAVIMKSFISDAGSILSFGPIGL